MTREELSALYDDILDMTETATASVLELAPGTEFAKQAVALQDTAEYAAAHARDLADADADQEES